MTACKMEKTLLDSLLFDFYSELLTARQREFYELYYLQDMSLSEIAEQYSVSPQAVNDILRRTVKILSKYELTLGIVAQHTRIRESAENMLRILSKMKQTGWDDLLAAELSQQIKDL